MDTTRSREGVLAFLEYCKDKGLLKPPTAEARKAAVNQVLGILSDAEASDVGRLDLDSVLRRFQNLHGRRYTPDSLRTYRARVRNSIEDYLRYCENPMDFQPRLISVSRKKKGSNSGVQAASGKLAAASNSASRASMPMHLGPSTLPIPLRADLTVLVHGLPYDLTQGEAQRIANVILAMAMVDR